MSKRRARRPARPHQKDAAPPETQAGGVVGGNNVVAVGGAVTGATIATIATGDGSAPLSPPDDEGIDYSDIPDVGDDDAYWKGGRVGPVLPVKAAERPS